MKQFSYILSLLGLFGVFFSGTVDLDNVFNYANQEVPDYIFFDNTSTNQINDRTATLGRVLFYDKTLSRDNTVSCSSCHKQAFAFSDSAIQSEGVSGVTSRHSMRLINTRFGIEESVFWDERAATLEDQVTQPIQDHIELGYSGTNGDPDINDLIELLSGLDYYQQLFTFAYGTPVVTELRIKLALAQFVRSIQSFDSKFDQGMVLSNEQILEPFPNFTSSENLGKELFLLDKPVGANCATCHQPPEFSIDFVSLNNGVTATADGTGVDYTNFRSPTLRDLVNPDGIPNTPYMHNGAFPDLMSVIEHYNAVPFDPNNELLDPDLLDPNTGEPQQLMLTPDEKLALIDFLGTLSGNNVYTDEKWSDPFEPDGTIEIIGGNLGIYDLARPEIEIQLSPNPARDLVQIKTDPGQYAMILTDTQGKKVMSCTVGGQQQLSIGHLAQGLYYLSMTNLETGSHSVTKLIKG